MCGEHIKYIALEHLQSAGNKELSGRPEIDETDIRILKTLLKDPRTSFAEIAEDCKLSTNAIRMRFTRLKKTGVITGSTIFVNPKSMGYEGIGLLAIEADINKEQDVMKFLEKIPNVIYNHLHIGKHNIVSMLLIKNVDDLVHTVDLVKRNPHIRKTDTAITENAGPIEHFENLVFNSSNVLPHTGDLSLKDGTHKPKAAYSRVALDTAGQKHFNPSPELDKIDISLIKMLSKDARMSFRKIAKKLGVSTKTAIKRFERLQKGVISRSTITLNLRKIGYLCNAVFCINVSPQGSAAQVVNEIIRIPNVIIATKCVGGIDILAIAPFAKFEELFELKQEIAKISGIKQMEILLEKTFTSWPQNMFSKVL